MDDEMPSLLKGDGKAFERRFNVTVGEEAEMLREVVQQTLALGIRVPRPTEWGGFFIVDEERRAVVGMGGYKGGPNARGEVEIAYGTLPAFEGQGYGTEAAAELTRRALHDPTVQTVVAHTFAEKNASARLLEKNRFQLVGEVDDPEDGRVWRWTYGRNPSLDFPAERVV